VIVVKKLLYMLGVLVALIAILGGGLVVFFGAQNGAWPSVIGAAAVACASAGFIWFAYRRTSALEAERQARERSERAAALDAALARRVASSRFVARRSLLWVSGAAVLAAGFAGGAMLTWSGGAHALAVLIAAVTVLMLWYLLPALASRDAIVVDPRGIELPGFYTLIPWSAIQEVFLSTHEVRGGRIVEARLGVVDRKRYRSSRWGFPMRTSDGDHAVVPLRGLDQSPETIFAAIRQFHERAAPRGTLVGVGASYRIDPRAARLEAIHKRMLEVGEEMKQVAANLERQGPVENDSPQMKAFERDSESRIKELDVLGAEASSLITEQTREIENRVAIARRSLNRLRWLTYAFLTVVILYAIFRVLAR
jgi:hypothetical protein